MQLYKTTTLIAVLISVRSFFALFFTFVVTASLRFGDWEVAESLFLPAQKYSIEFAGVAVAPLNLLTLDTERRAIVRGQRVVFLSVSFCAISLFRLAWTAVNFQSLLKYTTFNRISRPFYKFNILGGFFTAQLFCIVIWAWDFQNVPFTFLEEHSVNAEFRDRASLLATQRDSLVQLFWRSLISILSFVALFVKTSVNGEQIFRVFIRTVFPFRTRIFLGGEGIYYDLVIFVVSALISETLIFLKRVIKNRQHIRFSY